MWWGRDSCERVFYWVCSSLCLYRLLCTWWYVNEVRWCPFPFDGGQSRKITHSRARWLADTQKSMCREVERTEKFEWGCSSLCFTFFVLLVRRDWRQICFLWHSSTFSLITNDDDNSNEDDDDDDWLWNNDIQSEIRSSWSESSDPCTRQDT